MQVHHELWSNSPQVTTAGYAVTVGTFDGVHRGHQSLVEALRREAHSRGLRTAVLTFVDMPYCYFRPDDGPRLLTLAPEKIAAFERLGVDDLWIVPFTAQVAKQSAGDFVRDVLMRQLGMKLMVAGPDFALGKGREGDIPTLRALGQGLGFEVVALDGKLMVGGRAVSSTRVRGCVEAGDIGDAAEMLGQPFNFSGEVISGRQLGRTIGVPTINMKVAERKVIPANGIYAARAYFDNESGAHRAALSIGNNPTVGGTGLNIEFHVIGEEIPQPPQVVRLELVERLRDEQHFPDLTTLVEQMQRDIRQADELLAAAG
jgi:riboflavin kinase/FMN adenylyltransferase